MIQNKTENPDMVYRPTYEELRTAIEKSAKTVFLRPDDRLPYGICPVVARRLLWGDINSHVFSCEDRTMLIISPQEQLD